jgi:hypothetical protein
MKLDRNGTLARSFGAREYPEKMIGEWNVDAYLDDSLIESVDFTITN